MKMSIALIIIGSILLLVGVIGCKSLSAGSTLSPEAQQVVDQALSVAADLGLAAAQAGVAASGLDPAVVDAINSALTAVAPGIETAILGMLKAPGTKDINDVRHKAWTADSVRQDVLATAKAHLKGAPRVK